jgi:hypothetical protein
VVFPLSLRLLKDNPPDTLEVYNSMSQWSCYKMPVDSSSDWMKDGMERLRQATEEQYLAKDVETATEVIRREQTVLRQEIADTALQQYLQEEDHIELSPEDFRKQMETAREETIPEEARKWEEKEELRIKAAIEEKERLQREYELYKERKWDIGKDIEMNYWAILIGGTAIMGAVLAIMKGYHYI